MLASPGTDSPLQAYLPAIVMLAGWRLHWRRVGSAVFAHRFPERYFSSKYRFFLLGWYTWNDT
jgi:hypothetical protein